MSASPAEATDFTMSTIGVLAVQGAFARHAEVVRGLGHQVRLVRDPAAFAELDGLILPGGESTVQLRLIARLELEAPLRAFVARGKPLLATCAGLILIARTVGQPQQPSFGLIDVALTRNAWGRQLDSFEAVSDEPEALPLVFIRAPRITECGSAVEIRARYRGEAVLVRERNLTCATFHPELSDDTRVHASVFG
jgi:pyridoxal 5'-phosphate synthase pdxT subunit